MAVDFKSAGLSLWSVTACELTIKSQLSSVSSVLDRRTQHDFENEVFKSYPSGDHRFWFPTNNLANYILRVCVCVCVVGGGVFQNKKRTTRF